MSADEQPDFTLYCHPADEERAKGWLVTRAQWNLPGTLAVKVHPRVSEGEMFLVCEQDLPSGWEPGSPLERPGVPRQRDRHGEDVIRWRFWRRDPRLSWVIAAEKDSKRLRKQLRKAARQKWIP